MGSGWSGRAIPCGQKGRLDQFSTRRTGPMAPAQTHSQSSRVASEAELPTATWVATLLARATSAIRRAS